MSTNRRKGAPRSGEMGWSIKAQSVKEEVLAPSKTPPPPAASSSSTSPYMTTSGGLYDLDTLDEGTYLCLYFVVCFFLYV